MFLRCSDPFPGALAPSVSNHFRPPTKQEEREIQMATDGIPHPTPGLAGPSAMDFSS